MPLEGTINTFKQEDFVLSKYDNSGAMFNLNYDKAVFYKQVD